MTVYTVELFTGDGWDLVLATLNEDEAYGVDPMTYGYSEGSVAKWVNGEKVVIATI